MSKFVSPALHLEAFNCPHCGAYAHMIWHDLYYDSNGRTKSKIRYVQCSSCKEYNVWIITKFIPTIGGLLDSVGHMISPVSSNIALPSDDMPEDVKKDYLEAASIYQKSPRGAVALLRLGLQKLCIHLGGKGKNINDDLAALAKDELISKKLIKSADIIRIVGNNAVHPGTISDGDFDDVSFKLFTLINMIVQQGITEPKEVDNMFGSLPEGPRQAAENRDKPKP
ncbi:TPA: DUF4145 domain-containing protein [Providencia stuartii]|nr:DUF4145 domain-containing protein [Providencia rettgeri]HEF8772040.1 DUF4145 domain-containing protein [Providencia stuartii]